MSEILPEVIDRMMVKCGRRCCICKRFRPTKLQVHHIQERAKGGSNDEDNLIVTCFSCHSDVHTIVPFARRFSQAELKAHRDTLIEQVAKGILPAEDTDDTDEAIRSFLRVMRTDHARKVDLLPEATEILLNAAYAKYGGQGSILGVRHDRGFSLIVGGNPVEIDHMDKRLEKKYEFALRQLIQCGLVERVSGEVFEVSWPGYLVAEEIMARGSQALTE